MEDMKLLHHFSTVVYLTLSNVPEIRTMWQCDMPNLAINHTYLMHSILGLSALHLVHSDPSNNEKYKRAVIYHQDTTLVTLRPLLQEVTAENCDAVCASATITALFASGLHQTPGFGDKATALDGLLEAGELGRGVHVIVNASREWIMRGKMSPMLNLIPWDFPPPLAPDIANALQELVTVVNSAANNEPDRVTYLSAIKVLRQTFEATGMNSGHPSLVLSWLVFVDRHFFNMMKKRDAISMLILAYYGVVLQGSSEQWWSDNWGVRILELVTDILKSNAENRHLLPLLDWPARRVRHSPLSVQSFVVGESTKAVESPG
jgi:hypothetical protein